MDASNFHRKAAGFFGFTGVALGAFGAHMLKQTFAKNGTTDSWKTAVSYQLVHALALLAVSTREVDVNHQCHGRALPTRGLLEPFCSLVPSMDYAWVDQGF